MPVNYSWTASNGNTFTNVIEVLEDHTYADDLDMNTIGNTVKGNYTWKNEWYVNRDGSGTKIDYDVDKPNGNDITIYGKWVSTITRNNNGAGAATPNVEVIKGQQIGAVNLPTLSSAYTWRGWFKEVGFTNAVTASWVPTGNAVVYAKWTSIVTYMNPRLNSSMPPGFESYVTYQIIEVIKGQGTTLPTMPDLSGDPPFARSWYNDAFYTESAVGRRFDEHVGTRVGRLGETYVPTGNITLYGQYEK